MVLATYSSYDAAQRAVDVLARHDFPFEHVTIVGCDLRWEEKVLGRWGLGRALLTGAGTGGWIGLLVADHYDILVDPEFADEARRVLTDAREAAALR
ncbi:hypothetical protein Msi02_68550 [Microbispora siamensis]|uniref:General stress protein 17M-like domain-containing protein n=1 Tax=Microbispora siamensis TaxID=564413 RepID=A0ABQ4GX70_9ACTN|nr:hypothetical protein Msi02_68550 [Microbispora siamensis]